MNFIDKIRINSSLPKVAVASEPTKEISSWFKDEKMELNFGEYTGRPSSQITLHKEYLTKFFESGWSIDAVIFQKEDGSWESRSVSDSTSSSESSNTENNRNTNNSGSGYNNTSYSKTSGTATFSSSHSEDEKESGYWAAYQRIRLKRRRMQPELVLQSMMDSYTNAYNTGRNIENDRYYALVSIYAMTLSNTEKELNTLISGALDVSSLFTKLAKSLEIALTGANNSAARISMNAEADAIEDVRRQFDALIAQAKAQMITNGTYNSTVWPTTLAGIERQYAAALTKAKNESAQLAVSAWTSVASAKTRATSALMSAKQSISDALDKRRLSATEARNSVVKWIVDFAGQREEVYPELQEISQLTERLGFSVGAAGNVL